MFQVLIQFISPLAGLNHTAAISRQYFEQETIRIKNYFGNGLYILIFTSLFTLLSILIFKTPIAELTGMPPNWLWVVVLFCFCQNLAQSLLVIWQVKFKAKKFGLFRIARTSLDVGLSILFILGLGMSWQGRILGTVTAIVAFSILALLILWRKGWLSMKFNKAYIIDNLKFGAPLIPHTLGSVIIMFSDRLFITNMIGMEAQGLYSVGYNVAMIVYLFQNSFNQAWVPWFYGELKKDNPRQKVRIVKFTYLYFLLMIILVGFVSFFAPWFFDTFLNSDYSSAIRFVFWIALGFGFNGMYKMIVNYIFFLKKTYIISIVSIATASLNILLNYFFIKKFGPIGAAQASAISFFTQFLLIWGFSAKLFKMPWLLKKK